MISEKTASMLEFNIILEKLAARTVSEQGRDAAFALRPADSPERALLLMNQTKEAETLMLRRPSYPMISFSSVVPELARLDTGASLNAEELLRLAGVYKAAKYVRESIASEDGISILKEIVSGIYYDETAARAVYNAIDDDGAVTDRASDELYRIRRSINRENAFIREKLQSFIKNSDYSKSLQDRIVTQRNGRYVIPVKHEYRSDVPGIVHAQSGSGSTLFIEPAGVVDANNRISELMAAEQAEIEVILTRLSALYAPFTDEIRRTSACLAELDVIFAKASYGVSLNAVPVTFTDGEFRIMNGRHPLIDAGLVIPIDVELRKGITSLVITGPNTGGKTVTLKMCGLFALMAQSGMFVPAHSGVRLPFFDSVFADIGDEQSISQSLSTFSSHLMNITYILRHATGHSLVLLDEIGAGTEPQEGSALARAVLDELHGRGSVIFATTHYSELKEYASATDGFDNASMEFDAVALKPTYRLLTGVPGMSNALLIARRLGVKKNIIDKAYGFLGAEHASFSELMDSAKKAETLAKQEKEKYEKLTREAAEKLEKAEEKLKKAEEKAREKLKKADEKALDIVRNASDESEQLINRAKKLARKDESERTKVTKEIRDRFDSKKDKISRNINRDARKTKVPEPGELVPGRDVRIVSMDIPGVVTGAPDAKGNVRIQAGIMQIDINYTDLELAQPAEEKKASRTYSVQLDRTKKVSMDIDLHGMAVDDACIVLDKYLDDAYLAGLHNVTVIHGIGTGVLKKGVRDFMRRNAHVKSMRDGQYGEGGPGVTVVTFK